MNTCKTCIACKVVNDKTGECHMNPPGVQLVMVGGMPSVANPKGTPQLTAQRFFPPVALAEDYCLQHRPKLAS